MELRSSSPTGSTGFNTPSIDGQSSTTSGKTLVFPIQATDGLSLSPATGKISSEVVKPEPLLLSQRSILTRSSATSVVQAPDQREEQAPLRKIEQEKQEQLFRSELSKIKELPASLNPCKGRQALMNLPPHFFSSFTAV